LVSACQVVNTLVRPGRPSTMSFLFTEIMNDGAFRGTLRGLSMNFLQTSLILWPAVAITNKTQGGLFDFVLTFTLLDAILHPLDTIKNRMYASTQYPLSISSMLVRIKRCDCFNRSSYIICWLTSKISIQYPVHNCPIHHSNRQRSIYPPMDCNNDRISPPLTKINLPSIIFNLKCKKLVQRSYSFYAG
jgi:hypothetical protein